MAVPFGEHRRYGDDQPSMTEAKGKHPRWVATELQRREPHNLAFAMMIVERLGDFKQCERLRSPRDERTKDGGDGRSNSGSPKATDDERSGDEGHRRHHKGEKKHEESRKQGDSRDHKAHGGLIRECFYCEGQHCERYCPHNGKMTAFFKKHKSSKGDSSSSEGKAWMATLPNGQCVHWLGLKPTKDGNWFTAVNAEERQTKGVVKKVDLRIYGWTWKADFNIIDMDDLGVVLGMDFMEKSSATLNPYYGVMMVVGKEVQPEWMILLVSKDGANECKGITVLHLDERLTLCYVEWQIGPRTYAVINCMMEDTMDKEWLNLPRASPAYYQGVSSFLDFAFGHVGTTSGEILCPCTRCVNCLFQDRDTVEEHLVRRGFASHYRIWTEHGEVDGDANLAPDDDVGNEDATTEYMKDGKVRSRTNMYIVSCTCKDGTVLESAKGKLLVLGWHADLLSSNT
ncbi:hypothetical protein RJ639_023517 [Escallonia herrerae]|uniref:Transposase-associated domain-containing protein n=1 Tax=Escallonia herrerae TaxID=1293975 RepID=A0AA88V0C7_9ASTE|nr:hypothetical protein RJ639_023517 [Escallonia herrerae]